MAGYIKIEGIDGESTAKGYEKWIGILSVSQSITRPIGAGMSGSSRHRSTATLGDVVCVKEVDKSTPKLADAICEGKVFPSIELHMTTSSDSGEGRTPYLMWKLTNVRVTSYSVSGSTDGMSVPTEQFSLNYEEIKQTYDELDKENKSKGKVEYSWKVEEGTT
jgi:type VI secretion system secreted protein Hcp